MKVYILWETNDAECANRDIRYIRGVYKNKDKARKACLKENKKLEGYYPHISYTIDQYDVI